jgi:ATP-dependent DNA ligase
LHELPANAAVLDGEVVASAADGRPNFARLHVRWTRQGTIQLWAFDLLALNGQAWRPQPLVKRQARLQALPERFGRPAISLSEPFEDGLALRDGAPNFYALPARMHRRLHELAVYAIDLLRLDGADLRPLPLIERRRRLKRRPSTMARISSTRQSGMAAGAWCASAAMRAIGPANAATGAATAGREANRERWRLFQEVGGLLRFLSPKMGKASASQLPDCRLTYS